MEPNQATGGRYGRSMLVKKDATGRLKVDLKANWNHWRNRRWSFRITASQQSAAFGNDRG
jgi:hypothetical protein